MRAVNLLPRDVERTRADTGRAPVLVLAGGLAVVTVAALALMLSASGKVGDQRANLEATQSALAATPGAGSGQAVAAQAVVVEERANRVAALSAALSTRVPLDRLLRELSYVLPDDVWLTSLSATSGDGSTLGATGGTASSGGSGGATPPSSSQASNATSLTIEGATYTQDAVARVLARLSVLPSLEGVRLTKSERVEPQAATAQPGSAPAAKPAKGRKPRTIVTFSIDASFAGGTS